MAESQLLKQWFAEGGAAVRYCTLELRCPDFSQTHYLVSAMPDSGPLQAQLEDSTPVEFIPSPISMRLPEQGVQGRESLQVTLDGVSRDVLLELERNANGAHAPITAVYREYLDSDLTGPQDIRELTLRNPSVSSNRVTAECTYSQPINLPFPRTKYTSLTHPGLNV